MRGELLQTLNKQDYTFMPLSVVTKADGETFICGHHQMHMVARLRISTDTNGKY
jgi:RNA-directed DNA polymerase